MALDSNKNLYLSESYNSSSQGNIIEYTAASSYSSSSTFWAFSQSGSSSNCSGDAFLAFDNSGNLWINANYYNGTNCNSQLGIFSSGGLTNILSTPNGAGGDPIAFDSSGHLWLVAGPCSGCSPASNGGVYEWTSLAANAAPTTVVSSLPSGTGDNFPTQPVFDGSGNLWFALQIGSISSSSCNTGEDIEELPSGTTSLTTAYTYSSCNLVNGLSVIPVPTGLPLN
jgi:beta-xylosidase